MSQRQKLMALPLNVLESLVTEGIEVLKERRRTEARMMAHKLSVGNFVKFTHNRTKELIVGQVKEIKQTKALVKTATTTWNVPMSMLTIVSSPDKPAAPPGAALF